MSPGQGEEVEGQGQPDPMEEGAQGASPEVEGQGTGGQPGQLEEGGPGASPEAPPVGPPPNPEAPGGPLEGTEETVQPKAAPEPEKLPPHLNLWAHSCGILTAGAPPSKCPGCQRLSPEGEWFLYKVALV